jgi:transketolase
MRQEFSKVIIELSEADNDVIVLCGDFGHGVFDEYRKCFPKRFYNLGSCEQSIIGISAGMAMAGFKPYVFSMTPFLIEKPFEHIKLAIDEQNVNVKLVGFADYPDQNATHRELNGKGLMGLLKNVVSYFPTSPQETRQALMESYASPKPAFISLKRARPASH